MCVPALFDQITSFPIPELLNDAEWYGLKKCIIWFKDLYISVYYRQRVDNNLSLKLVDSALNKLEVLNKNAIIWISGDFNAVTFGYYPLPCT